MNKITRSLFAAALALMAPATTAQASDPFVGEIRSFGFNFCPRGWAKLDGTLLAVSQNDALFSLLGTIYGGDGRTTFGLPDLRGRVALHQGTGPNLSTRRLGAKEGQENVTLTTANLANHTHGLTGTLSPRLEASTDARTSNSPAGAYLSTFTGETPYTTSTGAGLKQMGANSAVIDISGVNLVNSGNNQPTPNMAPYEVTNFCIALFGIYPSRN